MNRRRFLEGLAATGAALLGKMSAAGAKEHPADIKIRPEDLDRQPRRFTNPTDFDRSFEDEKPKPLPKQETPDSDGSTPRPHEMQKVPLNPDPGSAPK